MIIYLYRVMIGLLSLQICCLAATLKRAHHFLFEKKNSCIKKSSICMYVYPTFLKIFVLLYVRLGVV